MYDTGDFRNYRKQKFGLRAFKKKNQRFSNHEESGDGQAPAKGARASKRYA